LLKKRSVIQTFFSTTTYAAISYFGALYGFKIFEMNNCGFSGWKNLRLAGGAISIFKKEGDKLSAIM
jgi:hypothetical protein